MTYNRSALRVTVSFDWASLTTYHDPLVFPTEENVSGAIGGQTSIPVGIMQASSATPAVICTVVSITAAGLGNDERKGQISTNAPNHRFTVKSCCDRLVDAKIGKFRCNKYNSCCRL
jgi:hypothetical protein